MLPTIDVVLPSAKVSKGDEVEEEDHGIVDPEDVTIKVGVVIEDISDDDDAEKDSKPVLVTRVFVRW